MSDNVIETTGLDEAANTFAGFLSDDLLVDNGEAAPKTPAVTDEQSPGDAEGDEATENSHETQSDDQSDAENGDDEGEESEENQEATADEEDDAAPTATPKTATVKIDGKEVEVPFEEVVAGYQRQADYSRKTAALADERRAFDGLRQEFDADRTAVVQERGQYKELLTALHARLDELSPQEPDWQALFARDKNEYLLQRDNWRAIQEQKQAAASELERVNQAHGAERVKAHNTRVQAGQAKLLELEPKWKDEKVRGDDFRALAAFAKDTLGYSNDELKHADDPRALYAVYLAMKFQALQKKAATVQQTAKTKRTPTLAAGAASRQTTPQTRSAGNAMKRLAKTGSVDDAATLMSDHLEL